MDNFQKKFVEEATDLINVLEQALLELEKNPEDKNLISEIFRVMHSLKGGGAMFGFDEISDFTHHLENIYDLVRSDEMEISRDLLDLTLASVDHLRNLLEPEITTKVEENNKLLSKKLEQMISRKDKPKNSQKTSQDSDKQDDEESQKSEWTSYCIHFEPPTDIFENGTNPLFLIEELHELGNVKAYAYINTPFLDKFKINECRTSWKILLSTRETQATIRDVFIFVEDESKIEIEKIAENNIFDNKDLISKLDASYRKGKKFTIFDIRQLLGGPQTKNLQQPLDLAEEFTDIKASKPVAKANVKEKLKSFSKENVISSIRVSSDKIDQLMNLVSEMVTTQASLSLFVDEHQLNGLIQISENIENITRQLRDNAFSISLIPIDNLITRFQRLVRDLSSEFGKEIELITQGADTELDKTLIQSITEPLMHIIRNSIDHGIESGDERVAKGKPAKGTIMLKAFYSGANVHIQIEDDGRGIDPQFIYQRAISKGLIQPDAELSNREIFDLLFLPGFSTAKNITDVSGRGVGMDVVRRKIDEIRGDVELLSTIDKGTRITLKLPLTLSIIDGLLVKIGKTNFVIPLSVVDKIYAANHDQLVDTFNNIIVLDGQQIPFYYLREEFDIQDDLPDHEEIIVVKYDDKRIGLAVDNVVGEYQAVLKPLGKHYKEQEIISGATILGDGTIALVLDTTKIINEYSNHFSNAL